MYDKNNNEKPLSPFMMARSLVAIAADEFVQFVVMLAVSMWPSHRKSLPWQPLWQRLITRRRVWPLSYHCKQLKKHLQ